MVNLTSYNLYDFFSVATTQDSATVVGKKLFDFIDRQSDTLIVTIGDSWTWGADLTQHNLGAPHVKRLPDDTYRIKHVYGNVVAEAIGADFLNLGESGSGNWYIARKLQELHKIHLSLPYHKIVVISVWTELGRDVNSSHDRDVDYRLWLLDNIKTCQDYYSFMDFVHDNIAKHISHTVIQFDPRFRFYFATNFVDPIGVDCLASYWIDRTWLEIICDKNRKIYEPARCYTVFPWCIEKFDMVFDVAPELSRIEWLKWINEITEHANVRAGVCYQDNINFGNLLHPSAVNHQHWANYLLEMLTP